MLQFMTSVNSCLCSSYRLFLSVMRYLRYVLPKEKSYIFTKMYKRILVSKIVRNNLLMSWENSMINCGRKIKINFYLITKGINYVKKMYVFFKCTVFLLKSTPWRLLNFRALSCGTYWRATLKRRRLFFQSQK